MPEKVDVLIVGSGSAGLCAAVWLSKFNIPYTLLERRSGPLEVGQADGVQTRTIEIFDSFGIAEDVLRQAYHVLEVAFWAPSESDSHKIERRKYAADKETGISHQPHVILNQARMNGLMISLLGDKPPVEYGTEVLGVAVSDENDEEYPVTVTARRDGDGEEERVYQAKYVLGCDGAHSTVRKSLGFRMVGDSTDAVWGVMDIYPRTTFPDIRKKAVVASAAGNILVIPREGDAMVRFYIELPPGTVVADVSLESLQEQARLIFQPYEMEFPETAWWSAYAIGQRHADFFHHKHRVFLTGDACHTHSPKAGQGMNVSLQDGHNIGWKLGMVLKGLADPAKLLPTYVSERERTAIELIEFDREFTRLFSSKYRAEHGITPEYFAEQFVRAGRYTAGQAVRYGESVVTTPKKTKELAGNVTVGMRFPSAQVVRFCDAKAMQLVKGMPGDGQWFVVVFAGDLARAEHTKRLRTASEMLQRIVARYTPADYDPDRVIDRVLVLASKRQKIEQEQIPEFFTPTTGKWKMKNLFKTYVDDESYNSGHGHAYQAYGVHPERGAVVVVRPDQYVGLVTSLDEVEAVGQFFDGFMHVSNVE
ncbi:putative monooxygenase [Echria macrotheca]|uniref:Monooxygenase n=1 Tax=Echria macrotheca TaxID=438768 RepID=A0AAJ0B632_9PEZI|nr:putative monooxygenase [Echria macrotheca]